MASGLIGRRVWRADRSPARKSKGWRKAGLTGHEGFCYVYTFEYFSLWEGERETESEWQRVNISNDNKKKKKKKTKQNKNKQNKNKQTNKQQQKTKVSV